MKKAAFVHYDEISPVDYVKGVHVKPIMGDRVGATVVRFDKGLYLPASEHEHADEQIGFCLKGKMEWTIRDDSGEWTQMVTEGMAYVLPPHTAHGVRVLEDSVYIEIWCPPERHRETAKKLGLSFSESK